ncbi:hypothetical protein diail_7149 [Diaporthe ilicicola]|nr:hypothetical protein diail_7149 [Diaporthe ilicicola]
MPNVSTPKDPQVPFYSSLTFQKIFNGSELGTQYWVDNLTSPVWFSTAISKILLQPGRQTFVGIGPHGSLDGPLRQIFKAANTKDAGYTSVLTRGQDSHASLLKALGELWSENHSLDLGAVFGTTCGTFLNDLPLYPWHYEERIWNESRLAREWRLREFLHHDILGSRVLESTDHAPAWRNLLRLDAVPWIKDHDFAADIVFPGVGYIAMTGEAIRQLTGAMDFTARRVHIKAAMILAQDAAALETVTQLQKMPLTSSSESDWYSFTIFSHQNGSWLKHASGEVRANKWSEPLKPNVADFAPLPRLLSAKAWYRKFRSMGIEYGPQFLGLKDMTADTREPRLVAGVTNDVRDGESPYAILHPATLDCVLQAAAPAVSYGLTRRMGAVGIPSYIEEMYICPPGSPEMTMHVVSSDSLRNAYIGDAMAVSNGKMAVQMKGVQMSPEELESCAREREGISTRVVKKLEQHRAGLASTLFWKEMPEPSLGAGMVRVKFMAVGMNFKVRSILSISHTARGIYPIWNLELTQKTNQDVLITVGVVAEPSAIGRGLAASSAVSSRP